MTDEINAPPNDSSTDYESWCDEYSEVMALFLQSRGLEPDTYYFGNPRTRRAYEIFLGTQIVYVMELKQGSERAQTICDVTEAEERAFGAARRLNQTLLNLRQEVFSEFCRVLNFILKRIKVVGK